MNDIKELCIEFGDEAKRILQKDKELCPIAFFVTGLGVQIISLADYEKDEWNPVISMTAKMLGADTGAIVCECWMAPDMSVAPSKHEQRQEAILVHGFAPNRQVSIMIPFERFGDKFAFDEATAFDTADSPDFRAECRFTKGVS